ELPDQEIIVLYLDDLGMPSDQHGFEIHDNIQVDLDAILDDIGADDEQGFDVAALGGRIDGFAGRPSSTVTLTVAATVGDLNLTKIARDTAIRKGVRVRLVVGGRFVVGFGQTGGEFRPPIDLDAIRAQASRGALGSGVLESTEDDEMSVEAGEELNAE